MPANPDTPRAPSDGRPANRVSGQLDQALKATFPASDAVGLTEPLPRGEPERRVVEREVEARQAVTGHNVRYVLIFGLIGVIAAFVLVYLAYRA